MMRRAVFLDRDGVINKAIVQNGIPHPPASISELEILPGVPEALRKLHDLDYLLIVITNQPDASRGAIKKENIEAINAKILSNFPIDEIKTCFHDDIDKCQCRKPLPGAIFEAANQYRINLSRSFMIGDRWRDIEAGRKSGCTTFFVDYGYEEKRIITADYSVASLLEAQKIITESY